MKSQNQLIATHLKQGRSLTGLQALELFGCFRLASRIWDLKQAGMNIKSIPETKNGKTYCRYRLIKKKEL